MPPQGGFCLPRVIHFRDVAESTGTGLLFRKRPAPKGLSLRVLPKVPMTEITGKPLSKLELAARTVWKAWGGYAKWTFCSGCGQMRHCRSAHGQKFFCLDCFDQGEHKRRQ